MQHIPTFPGSPRVHNIEHIKKEDGTVEKMKNLRDTDEMGNLKTVACPVQHVRYQIQRKKQ